MSHADQLIEIATELAMDAKDNVADLQRKLSAVETPKVEIEARLNTANHALERLSSFVSVRGSDLQCPRSSRSLSPSRRQGRPRPRSSGVTALSRHNFCSPSPHHVDADTGQYFVHFVSAKSR
jgi:hypothetical protein